MTRAVDWMVSFDFTDGYYKLGMREEDIDFFTCLSKSTAANTVNTALRHVS
jgi:hypothetical protein